MKVVTVVICSGHLCLLSSGVIGQNSHIMSIPLKAGCLGLDPVTNTHQKVLYLDQVNNKMGSQDELFICMTRLMQLGCPDNDIGLYIQPKHRSTQ